MNLYSIPRIGTVEFRYFNQSFNPRLITAITKLCQLFVEISIKVKYKEIVNFDIGNVFETKSPSFYLDKLYRILDLGNGLDCKYNLSAYDLSQLEGVIYKYKGIGIEDNLVLTHCKDFEISEEIINDGELVRVGTKPIPAGQTDIHNIKYSSILNK